MRIATIEKQIFCFDELKENAKEKVRNWYKENFRESWTFSNDIKELLQEDFPNSQLEVEYSLSYCQGDGLNIYGSLAFEDILPLLKNSFTEKGVKRLCHYLESSVGCIKLPRNESHYSYCVANRIDIANDITYELESMHYRNIDIHLLCKFEKALIKVWTQLCSKYEQMGYEYFYEVEDDEIQEVCDSNEYEFLEDGTFFIA